MEEKPKDNNIEPKVSEEKETSSDEKKGGGGFFLGIIIILIMLVGAYYFLKDDFDFVDFIEKKLNIKEKNNTVTPNNNGLTKEDEEDEDEDDNKFIIEVGQNDYVEEDSINYHSDLLALTKENTSFFKYKSMYNSFFRLETEDIKILDEYTEKDNLLYYLYINNNKVKIFDNESHSSYIINNLEANKHDYYLVIDEFNNDLMGIVYYETKDSKATYFSLKLNKKLYDGQYDAYSYVSSKYISGLDNMCGEEGCLVKKIALLSTNEEKILKTIEGSKNYIKNFDYYSGNILEYRSIQNRNGLYIEEFNGDDYNYYTEDLKIIVEKAGSKHISINNDGQLYVATNKEIDIFNKDGEKEDTIKDYDTILDLVDEHVIAINNNKLVIAKVYEDEIILGEWDSKNYSYNYAQYEYVNIDYEYNKSILEIYFMDSSITIDEIWKYCKKNTDICDAENKKDLSKLKYGRKYVYNFETNKISKEFSFYQSFKD